MLIALILLVLILLLLNNNYENFNIIGSTWETRYPGMVNQRYSYNDIPYYATKKKTCSWRDVYRDEYVYDQPGVIADAARLKELPLNLVNVYTDECGYNPDYCAVPCQPNYQGLPYLSYTDKDCASLTSKVLPGYWVPGASNNKEKKSAYSYYRKATWRQ
jgi:hypothetical protein